MVVGKTAVDPAAEFNGNGEVDIGDAAKSPTSPSRRLRRCEERACAGRAQSTSRFYGRQASFIVMHRIGEIFVLSEDFEGNGQNMRAMEWKCFSQPGG
ncbi:MAG: hypothetical protein LLF90_07375 [Methanomicrobiaceae archaeon]|nr:hypothetical protein [Methanomicrobiaceae archaeon]